MSITVVPARDAQYTVAQFFRFIHAVAGGHVGDTDDSSFRVSGALGITATVTGEDFSFGDGGPTFLRGGTLEGISAAQNGRPIFRVSDLDLTAADFNRAVQAVQRGDTDALDNLLLGRAWDYTGTAGRDILLPGSLVPDTGAVFDFRNNDRFDTGGGDDRFFSGRGNDTLLGNSGFDQLFGGRGDDSIAGGRDLDQLEGGRGADIFVMDHVGADVVVDFDPNEDRVRMVGERWTTLTLEDTGDGVLVRGARTNVFLEGLEVADLDRGDFLY